MLPSQPRWPYTDSLTDQCLVVFHLFFCEPMDGCKPPHYFLGKVQPMRTAFIVKTLACTVGLSVAALSFARPFDPRIPAEESSSSSNCTTCTNVDFSSYSGNGPLDPVCKNLSGIALKDCLLMECDKAKSKNNLAYGPNPVCPQTNGTCTALDPNFQQSPGTCKFNEEVTHTVNQVNPTSGELNDSGCSYTQDSWGITVLFGNHCTYDCIKDAAPAPNPTPTPNPVPTPVPNP